MERPIDVTMGHFNAIWQGDANDVILRCFELCSVPPSRLNLTSSETFSVRDVAGQLSELMGKSVRFVGGESECALLSNASQCVKQFGQPATPVSKLIQWIAAWTLRGGKTLGKPTGFESRDGRF